MTLEGAVNKTGIGLFLIMTAAYFTWTSPSPPIMIGGAIGGFVMAFGHYL